jgi:ABC-2 type transporter
VPRGTLHDASAPAQYLRTTASLLTRILIAPQLACACRTLMSACFLAVMFMAFGGMPQLAVTLQNREVWFKQREASFYTASSYAWSAALVQLPLSVVECFIFTVLFYFMIGLTLDGAGVCPGPFAHFVCVAGTAVGTTSCIVS